MVFSPVLFTGQAYFDGDLLIQYVPMRMFLKSCLVHGKSALWCPYLLGGQPFFADPNTMSAYPLTYLLLPFPVSYGFSVFYFLHFLLAAGGMYSWARTLGLSRESGLWAGLLFAFSGFFWWELIHPPLLAAFAWMPWWGAALEKVSQKLQPSWAFAAGLVFALLFLSGNFQMTLGALYGGGLYLGWRLVSRRQWRREPEKDRRLVLCPLFFLWGALPLLLLWVPAWEFMRLSDRYHATNLNYETFQADLSLNPRSLAGFLFPVKPFDAATGQTRPLADFLVNAGYLGPWAFFLYALGLWRGREKGMTGFLAITGTLAVLTAFGKYFPLHRFLCYMAPGFGLMRAPYRYLFLYCLAGSLLAAFGFEALKEMGVSSKEKSKKVGWGLVAVVYALLVLALWGWKSENAFLQWGALALGGLFLYFGSVGKKTGEWPFQAFLLALLTALLPTAWNCASSRWGPTSNFDYLGHSRELQRLATDAHEGRALIGDRLPYQVEAEGREIPTELPPDSVYTDRARIAFGYNPLSLDKTTDLYTLPPATFLKLMAVKCYATAADRWKIPGFSTVRENGVAYGLNPQNVPFVYSPAQALVWNDDRLGLQAMRDPAFNPYQTAYFSQVLPETTKTDVGPGHLEYDFVQDDPDEESFRLKLDRDGWAVFSEMNYPGWKSWVDGNPSAIYTANHAFRAVWVPSGDHKVTFRYEPVWWKPLMVGLLLWFLSIVPWVWAPWRKRFLKQFKS